MAMSDNSVELRLNFLNEAARALAVSSPTISAALGAAYRNFLAVDDKDIGVPAKDWDLMCREICGSCGNTLPPRPAKHMATKTKAKTLEPVQPATEQESKITKSASANSKQRKKARKGGLQAMLEKSKASSASGGLDLMDFMS
ncbi:hypothetical protein P280DRAFT_408107 [Massarina eburnea CBS 473.64]|uniref:Uncharacterized protein n=1 Tax=Massarina eburnea CBS 473.64 TaxID=1395130 RepID=A0A6A6RRM7_9PLEO|nr:hypothetical protein P280DRAFT_408107 [Massarina eburnea CBS 473.64]